MSSRHQFPPMAFAQVHLSLAPRNKSRRHGPSRTSGTLQVLSEGQKLGSSCPQKPPSIVEDGKRRFKTRYDEGVGRARTGAWLVMTVSLFQRG